MPTTQPVSKKPFYANPWVQVLVAIVAAVVFGCLSPAHAIAMKPLGDGDVVLHRPFHGPDELLRPLCLRYVRRWN
jgi:aerobic C4-dicarboxylate transport protein